MKREDYIWVAIRVFGIYLLVLAIVSLPLLVSSAYSTWAMRDLALDTRGDPDMSLGLQLASRLAIAHVTSLIAAAGKAVLFSLAGWYFLRRGSLIFRLVSIRDPLSDPTVGDAPGQAAQPTDGSDAAGP